MRDGWHVPVHGLTLRHRRDTVPPKKTVRILSEIIGAVVEYYCIAENKAFSSSWILRMAILWKSKKPPV